MKTYVSFCLFFTFVILACSKSETTTDEIPVEESVEASYAVLISSDGVLKPQLINANAEEITLNLNESLLTEKNIPNLSTVNGSEFIQYHKDGNCNGKITYHDFKNNTNNEIAVFSDLNDCNLLATDIAKLNNSLFISYELTSDAPSSYFVRVIDLSDMEAGPIDVSLDKKPVGLSVANNRLFILTLDELVSNENSFSVMDISTQTLIHEAGLGYSVDRIFTDLQENIIIGYAELHSTINSSTLAIAYTQYENTMVAPNFSISESSNFDEDGRLFYPMNAGDNSAYPLVPAIYDFSKKLVTIYAYENFLTEAKRNIEYEIETTTVVGYDEKNGLMLVGYQKMNTADKEGGLLRIKLAPEPELVDNIDLDGVPYEIIVN